MSENEPKDVGNHSLREKSLEAEISFIKYVRGYRRNLRVRGLAVGAAFIIAGGILAGESAGPARADHSSGTCPAPVQHEAQAACSPQDASQEGNKAAIGVLLGVCLAGGGAMCVIVAGAPETNSAGQ